MRAFPSPSSPFSLLSSLLAAGSSLVVAAQAEEPSEYPTTLFGVCPTVQQFREEMVRADAVIRAKVVKIVRRKEGDHADQDAIVQLARLYKGELEDEQPCVRMETFWASCWGENQPPTLPDVGQEVILPIEIVHPYTGSAPPNGQKVHYIALFYYPVREDGTINWIYGFPPEMQAHATLERFEKLILDAVNQPRPSRPSYRLGEVLLTDNFDDGSLAGWTFLEGGKLEHPKETAGFVWPDAVGCFWAGPHFVRERKDLGFEVVRDLKTGAYRGRRKQTTVEFGVVGGRLRLRSQHLWQHITAVTGDPEWTDYQISVDMYNFNDEPRPMGQVNYLKFGPYGRVHVPNFPETQGEHSLVAVEIGNYANYDVSEGTWGNSSFQIRCKYPEPPYFARDPSRLLRYTKMLDYEAWPIPQETKIHLTAKFMGSRVEGWIDGRKILQGEIPPDHPGAKRGRIAFWVFETWAEFDNLKVTRLVAVEEEQQ